MTGVSPRTVIGCFAHAFTVAGLVVAGLALFLGPGTQNAGLAGAFGLGLAAVGPLLDAFLWSRVQRTRRAREEGRFDRGPFETRATASTLALRDLPERAPAGAAEELVLEPGRGGRAGLLFTGALALLWCGLAVGLGLRWRGGPVLQLLPVIVVLLPLAAGFLLWFLRRLWLHLRPRPQVSIECVRLVPGGSARVRWSFPGAVPERLVVRLLEQRLAERSWGQRAGSTVEVQERRSLLLGEGSGDAACRSGEVLLLVPDDAQASREHERSALRWTLSLEASYPFAPDLREEFVLWVHAR